MTVANWTTSQVITQLNSGAKWSGSTITYAFPTTSAGMYTAGGEGAAFRAVDSAQKVYFLLALQTWDDLIPQTFQLTTSTSSDIEMGYTTSGIEYAHAYYPTNGSAWFNASESSLTSPTVGSYGFNTLIHELGHALGLNHMGDYNGSGAWSPSSYQDTHVLSIMSYYGPDGPYRSSDIMQADWTGSDGTTYSVQTPMVNDILAIQYMYGTSTDTRTGDTVYGFSSNITGQTANLYDFSINQHPILTIFDSGGTDTLNFSGWNTTSYINLTAGSYSSCNSMTNNIGIAYTATIENAIGGSGNDTLLGNDSANRLEGGSGNDQINGQAGNDTLIGGAGNDTLIGGTGTDTAIFSAAYSSYTITYNSGSGTYSLYSASTGTDSVTGVESFQFSDVTKSASELSGGTTTDTTAPTLISLSPSDDATGVATTANLVLTFDESVQAGSGNIIIYHADGTVDQTIAINDSTQVSFSGSTVTVNPASDLAWGSGYYVTVASGAITDLSGNNHAGISGTTAYNFTTSTSSTTDDYAWSWDTTGVVTVDGAATSGNIETVDDADLFKVTLTEGTTYVFHLDRTSGGLSDPVMYLYDPTGSPVTVDDDSGSSGNAEITYTATTSGTYYLGAYDYSTGTGGYTISADSRVAPADDYSGGFDTTGVVTVDGTAGSGVIEIAGDSDLFKVTLLAGVTYEFDLSRTTGGLTDPYLELYDPNGDWITTDDDGGGSGNAHITYTATASGTYYLDAWDYSNGTGGYTLSATSGSGDNIFEGTDYADILEGTNDTDYFYGYGGDDDIYGYGGMDYSIYLGNRNEYSIWHIDGGFAVGDDVSTDGIDYLYDIETVWFADMHVNLLVGEKAQTITASDLHSIEELYVAFFNRVPDADGLSYWIDANKAGMTLDQMCENFYIAAVQYSDQTGYSASMTNDAFVRIVYANVLGRTGTTAPPDADVQYWSSQLTSGATSKGVLVATMLTAARDYEHDATWYWVTDLLNNKITVADYFAVQQGLNYNTPADSITHGMEIAAAVTATDTAAAITLIGVNDAGFNLTA